MPPIPREGRHKFLVTEQFRARNFATGAFVEGEEEYDEDEILIRPDKVIFADPVAWQGQIWKGQEIVRFFLDESTFYAPQQLFAECTRPIIPDSMKEGQ